MTTLPQGRQHLTENLIGATLGAWRLESVLGQGAAATVYRARPVFGDHSSTGEVAAVKVLDPVAAANPRVRAGFQQEAQILLRLRHPSIVRVYDSGAQDGRIYIAMALITGPNLEEMLQQSRRLGETPAIDIAAAVAWALAAMHQQHIIHRDIKPSNILIDEGSRRPILFDFGAAIDLNVSQPTPGIVYGTPAFVSPEQARGDATIDGRADIYSLGVTLYRMLAGRKPFYGERMELLRQHIEDPPEPPSAFGYISPELERIVLKALEKRPEDRFQTAEEMAQHLEAARNSVTEPPANLPQRFMHWLRGAPPTQ